MNEIEQLQAALDAHLAADKKIMAIECLETMVHLDPGNLDLWIKLATLRDDLGLASEAAQAYRAIIDLFPDLAAAHSQLGCALAESGDLDKATIALEKSISLRPTASRFVLLASIQVMRGKRSLAERSLRRAVQIDSNHSEAWLDLGELIRDDRPDEARGCYQRALALDESHQSAVSRELGYLAGRAGDLAQAESLLRRALNLDPDDRWARAYLVANHLEDGRETDAIEELLELERRDPTWSYPRCKLGQIHSERGETDNAEACFRQALGLDPHDPKASLELARLLIARHDRDEAIKLLKASLNAYPDTPYTDEITRTIAEAE